MSVAVERRKYPAAREICSWWGPSAVQYCNKVTSKGSYCTRKLHAARQASCRRDAGRGNAESTHKSYEARAGRAWACYPRCNSSISVSRGSLEPEMAGPGACPPCSSVCQGCVTGAQIFVRQSDGAVETRRETEACRVVGPGIRAGFTTRRLALEPSEERGRAGRTPAPRTRARLSSPPPDGGTRPARADHAGGTSPLDEVAALGPGIASLYSETL